MQKSLPCPLCGSTVTSVGMCIDGCYGITTKCKCGLTYRTYTQDYDPELDYTLAWRRHLNGWNTRQYPHDISDIHSYAENIVNRTQQILDSLKGDGME